MSKDAIQDAQVRRMQDDEAEKALLGSMMADRSVIDGVLRIVGGRDFAIDVHTIIFQALCECYESSEPMDFAVVSHALRKRGELERIGGMDYLIHLAESFGDSANATYYAKIVAEYSQRRALWSEGYSMQSSAADIVQHPEPDQICLSAIARLEGIQRRATNETSEPKAIGAVVDGLDEFWERLGGTSISCGLPGVDLLIGQMRPPCYAILAARPTVGKTSLALNWLLNSPVNSLMVSLEQKGEAIAGRVVSILTGDSIARLIRWASPEERRHALAVARDRLADSAATIYFHDAAYTLGEIKRIIRHEVRVHHVGMVAIDYLQLIEKEGRHENRNVEVMYISRELRRIANELNIVLLVLCQLSREAAQPNVAPRLSHLRDSGAIEQDADVVMFLHPVEQSTWLRDKAPVVDLIVAKNKDGAIGSVSLRFDKAVFTFRQDSLDPTQTINTEGDVPW